MKKATLREISFIITNVFIGLQVSINSFAIKFNLYVYQTVFHEFLDKLQCNVSILGYNLNVHEI